MAETVSSPQPRGAGWERVRFALQTLLVLAVVGWVLYPPRGWFGFPLYPEKFLVPVTGLALGLAYLSSSAHPRFAGRLPWWDVAAAALGLALCLYTAFPYPALLHRLTTRPLRVV